MNVTHVRQQDACGCLVACLAMVTGRSYGELRDFFVAHGKVFEGEGGGMNEIDVEQYLVDHGFAYGKKYRWHYANIARSEWPVPPFAPVHICGVRTSQWHGVVLCDDGRVLDPLGDVKRLTDYSEVGYVLGVWRLPVHPEAAPSASALGFYAGSTGE